MNTSKDYDLEVDRLLKQFEPHNLLTEECASSFTSNNNQPIVTLRWVDNSTEIEEDTNADA